MPYRYFFVVVVLSFFQLKAQNTNAIAPAAESVPSTNSLDFSAEEEQETVVLVIDSLVKNLDTLSIKRDSLKTKPGFIVKEEVEAIIDSATIDMYKIFRQGKPTVFVDTTTTIQKEYKANFLRRDYFELLPLYNMASAFNRLGHDFSETSLQPQMGARSKHYAYFEIEDVKYYRIPTRLPNCILELPWSRGNCPMLPFRSILVRSSILLSLIAGCVLWGNTSINVQPR